MNKIILSICIPTYNRAIFLKSNLESIFSQNYDNDKVEIIVSNNCSKDNTKEIAESYSQYPNFKYVEQETNIGAVKNIFSLIDKYANGKFCWVIGDDDFILDGSIQAVLNLIKSHPEIDYIYATVKPILLKEYEEYLYPFNTSIIRNKILPNYIESEPLNTFEELISPDYSLIFLGEIMASIFKKELWIIPNNMDFESKPLETLETTYPHCIIFANNLFGKKSLFVKTPLILTLEGAREWWSDVGYVNIVQVKNLIDYYIKKGLQVNILNKCYFRYFEISFPYFLKYLFISNNSSKKINKFKYLFFIFSKFDIFISYISAIFIRKIKSI